jgi:diguanylate cyclase (GGDEF)-like protein
MDVSPTPDRPISVTVVEDSDADLALVSATLRRTRLRPEIRTARRIEEALDRSEPQPDCVLLDLGLPDAEQLEGLDRVLERWPTVPTVILTGNDDLAMASAALVRGAQDYLVKGQFDAPTLERTIRHAVERQRVQAELEAARALSDAVLDSIEAHTAVVDAQGVIISVNGPWRRFAQTNGAAPEAVGVGVSYLEVCRRAADGDGEDAVLAGEVARDLERLLRRQQGRFTVEYPCHGEGQERWFLLRATSIGEAGAVLVHLPVTDQVRRQRDLEELAFRDPLTGLANRSLWYDRLALLNGQRHSSGGVAVVFLDLDGFKAVNDRLGHAAGDELLRTVAHRLELATRGGDVLARYGGDEFVAAGRTKDAHGAVMFARRLADAARVRVDTTRGPVTVSASVGLTFVRPGDRRDAEKIVADADAAMFTAKRQGPGSVQLHVAPAISSRALGDRPPSH